MTEIRIKKKKPIWPWVILVIILAVLAFLYFYGSTETDDIDGMEDSEIEEVTYENLETKFHINEVEYI